MDRYRDIIKAPIITEKTASMEENRTYVLTDVFDIDKSFVKDCNAILLIA